MNILKEIINFILPPRCALCGDLLETDKGLCDKCIEAIDFISEGVCYYCGHPQSNFVDKRGHTICGNCLNHPKRLFRLSRSACCYNDVSQKLILDFKFRDRTDLSSLLAKMMYVSGKDIFDLGVDVIVPIPLHYTRLIRRRYNQSSLLAKELSKLTGVPVVYDAIVKSKMTRPQVSCNGLERLNNVKGAFSLKDSKQLYGKKVLLVDDVLTTGSTLKECGLLIKKAHPKSIDSLTIARVI